MVNVNIFSKIVSNKCCIVAAQVVTIYKHVTSSNSKKHLHEYTKCVIIKVGMSRIPIPFRSRMVSGWANR